MFTKMGMVSKDTREMQTFVLLRSLYAFGMCLVEVISGYVAILGMTYDTLII